MIGVGNALERLDRDRAGGLFRLVGVVENQLARVGDRTRRDLDIGHDGDGLGGVLRDCRLSEGQEAGHHEAGSQEKAMHRGVPPESDGWILIRGLLLATPSVRHTCGVFVAHDEVRAMAS